MKKVLLVAVALCLAFVKTQAQTQTINVPMGYSAGQCNITRTNNAFSVSSTITGDLTAASNDGYILLYTYADLYITDEGGDPDEHDFNSLGSSTNTTALTSGDVSVGSYHFISGTGHQYNIQYEYYALYYNPTYNVYDEEYGECSQDIQ